MWMFVILDASCNSRVRMIPSALPSSLAIVVSGLIAFHRSTTPRSAWAVCGAAGKTKLPTAADERRRCRERAQLDHFPLSQ